MDGILNLEKNYEQFMPFQYTTKNSEIISNSTSTNLGLTQTIQPNYFRNSFSYDNNNNEYDIMKSHLNNFNKVVTTNNTTTNDNSSSGSNICTSTNEQISINPYLPREYIEQNYQYLENQPYMNDNNYAYSTEQIKLWLKNPIETMESFNLNNSFTNYYSESDKSITSRWYNHTSINSVSNQNHFNFTNCEKYSGTTTTTTTTTTSTTSITTTANNNINHNDNNKIMNCTDYQSQSDSQLEPQSQSSKSVMRNHNHIKKPLNAFMLFMKEMRSKVIAEYTLKESAAINQILGRKWHELSKQSQLKYYELANKEKQLHQKLYPNWSARDNYAKQIKRHNYNYNRLNKLISCNNKHKTNKLNNNNLSKFSSFNNNNNNNNIDNSIHNNNNSSTTNPVCSINYNQSNQLIHDHKSVFYRFNSDINYNSNIDTNNNLNVSYDSNRCMQNLETNNTNDYINYLNHSMTDIYYDRIQNSTMESIFMDKTLDIQTELDKSTNSCVEQADTIISHDKQLISYEKSWPCNNNMMLTNYELPITKSICLCCQKSPLIRPNQDYNSLQENFNNTCTNSLITKNSGNVNIEMTNFTPAVNNFDTNIHTDDTLNYKILDLNNNDYYLQTSKYYENSN